jgi:hypothetical protein
MTTSKVLLPRPEPRTTPSRTEKYIAALVREGDSFDHSAWLQRVRQEEAAANTNVAVVLADKNPNKETLPKCEPRRLFCPTSKIKVPHRVPRPKPSFRIAARPPGRQSALSRRIAVVKAAWSEMKQKHARKAIFGYLDAVFELVMLYSRRGQIAGLVQRVLKMEGFPVRRMDPFSAIIRCTADSNLDRRTMSRWSRALRYLAHHKDPAMSLKKFVVEAGGINACADLFALTLGRGRRLSGFDDRNSD